MTVMRVMDLVEAGGRKRGGTPKTGGCALQLPASSARARVSNPGPTAYLTRLTNVPERFEVFVSKQTRLG